MTHPGLADLSDDLLLGAVLCYVVAMLGYAAELAFRPKDHPQPVAGGSTDVLPEGWTPAQVADMAAAAGRGWPGWLGRAAVAVTAVGWLLHVASVVTRGLAVERVPWGNMYEFSSVVCLAAVTGFLVLMTRQPVRYLGAAVMLPVVIYLGLGATVLYAEAAPLVPALNSYWLKIHVAAAATASGIFMVGFATTVLYLVQDVRERRASASPVGVPTAGSPTTDSSTAGPGRHRLPTAASLDLIAYRMTAFAFPIWTFAVIAGAIWAEAAWGRYWGWDPKETWAFITWVVYAGYLHARPLPRWQGRRAAAIAVVGFVALMFCYFGVNLWISGLHSYAGVD
ncbi:MAG TPA: c-type cytochrome biogenesis protein CcsB [Mycobacteriales bacterium]|nr:c-type cytochrome biogenesis protein CcsB [Mycobacteriales bacterium]